MISVRNIAFVAALASAGTASAWWATPYNGIPAYGHAPEAAQEQIKARQEAFEAFRKAQIEAIEAQRKAFEAYAKNMPEFTPAAFAPGVMITRDREAIEAFMASEGEQMEARAQAMQEKMDQIRAEREARIETYRKARKDRLALADVAAEKDDVAEEK